MITNRKEDAIRLWKQLLNGKETEVRYRCSSPHVQQKQNKTKQKPLILIVYELFDSIMLIASFKYSNDHMIYEWEDSPIRVNVHISDSLREGGWYVELSAPPESGISYLLPSLPDGTHPAFGTLFAWTGHPPRSPVVIANL